MLKYFEINLKIIFLKRTYGIEGKYSSKGKKL
jgi:hypothetical protein